tara:strand:- start:474 stop:743 length:270 start_codon:yes stop_codon:yes gene_type:complete
MSNLEITLEETNLKDTNNEERNTLNELNNDIGTWTQLAESLYEFLNRRGTTIEYSFLNMEVMVPKTTGSDAPQAKWNLNGSMRLRTWEA